MNISNYYWYFSKALTPKFCDDELLMLIVKKKLWLEQVAMAIENYQNKKY